MKTKPMWSFWFGMLVMCLGCGVSERSLEKSARNGRYDKILSCLKDIEADTAKTSLANVAVRLLLDPANTHARGKDYLEDLLVEKQQCSPGVRHTIAHSMLERRIAVTNVTDLCRAYLKELWQSPRGKPTELLNDLTSLVMRSNSTAVDSFFLAQLRRCFRDMDQPRFIEVVQTGKGYTSLKTGRMLFVESIVVTTQQLRDASERKELAQQHIPRLESEIKELDTLPLNSQRLEAYMVANVGYNQYEVALPKHTYLGRLPSERRAVLFTKETDFQTKGWFSLTVRRLEDSEVQLKEEFGSFNQSWPVYEEVTSSEIAEYNQHRQQLEAKRDSMRWLRNQATAAVILKADLEKQIDSILAVGRETVAGQTGAP